MIKVLVNQVINGAFQPWAHSVTKTDFSVVYLKFPLEIITDMRSPPKVSFLHSSFTTLSKAHTFRWKSSHSSFSLLPHTHIKSTGKSWHFNLQSIPKIGHFLSNWIKAWASSPTTLLLNCPLHPHWFPLCFLIIWRKLIMWFAPTLFSAEMFLQICTRLIFSIYSDLCSNFISLEISALISIKRSSLPSVLL